MIPLPASSSAWLPAPGAKGLVLGSTEFRRNSSVITLGAGNIGKFSIDGKDRSTGRSHRAVGGDQPRSRSRRQAGGDRGAERLYQAGPGHGPILLTRAGPPPAAPCPPRTGQLQHLRPGSPPCCQVEAGATGTRFMVASPQRPGPGSACSRKPASPQAAIGPIQAAGPSGARESGARNPFELRLKVTPETR
jgi:hypothetical protein